MMLHSAPMRRTTLILVTVFLLGSLTTYASRDFLQNWLADRCLQYYCHTNFGSPLEYHHLKIADGQLQIQDATLHTAEAVVTATILTIPYHLTQVADARLWTITNGSLRWIDDNSQICFDVAEHQSNLFFSERGRLQWRDNLLIAEEVPLPDLIRLIGWISPNWSLWRAETGSVQGSFQTDLKQGELALHQAHLRHSTLPIQLQTEGAALLFQSDVSVTLDQPLELFFGEAQQWNWTLPALSWRLFLADPKAIGCLIDVNKENIQGQLTATARSDGLQTILEGTYHSSDSEETVSYLLALGSPENTRGRIEGKGLKLERLLRPMAQRLISGDWFGRADLQGELAGDLASITLLLEEAHLETGAYHLQVEQFAGPLQACFSLTKGFDRALVSIKTSSFLDKKSGMRLIGASADVNTDGHSVKIDNLEAYHGNLRFTGSGTYTQLADRTHLDLHADTITGRLSHINELLESWAAPKGLMQSLPMDGVITLNPEGGDLYLTTMASGRELKIHCQGSIHDGKLTTPVANIALQDLMAQFCYEYPRHELWLTDIQGTAIVSRPGERIEEYQLTADHVHFSDYTQQQMDFDIWFGDRRRDVMRLAGETRLVRDQIHFLFRDDLTHLGSAYPESMELVLRDWTQVETFRLQMNFELAGALQDLQRMSRAGLLPIDETLSQSLESLQQASGICYWDCRYARPEAVFRYQLTSDLLALNHHAYRDFSLIGSIQDANWNIDQLNFNDVSLSAELQKRSDSWKIQFLGLKYGHVLLLGMEGTYSPHDERINARINLSEIDLSAFTSLPIRGKWKGSGKLTVDLAMAPKRYPLHADLSGSLRGCMINGIPINDTEQVRLTVSADQGSPSIRLRASREGGVLASNPCYAIKETSLLADSEQLRIDSELFYRGMPLWAAFRTSWKDLTSGSLLLSDTYPLAADPLTILWEQHPNLGFVATQAKGTLFGLSVHLRRDPRQPPFESTIQALGEVQLNGQKATFLLPPSLKKQITAWNIGSGYTLDGTWTLRGVLPESVDFRGVLQGHQCQLGNCELETLRADVQLSPQWVHLQNLTVKDTKGRVHADQLTLARTPNDSWQFTIENLVATDIALDQFNTAGSARWSQLKNWRLPTLIVDLSGELGKDESYVGEGVVQFARSAEGFGHKAIATKDFLSNLQSSPLIHPANGEIDWQLSERKLVLTALKDVYSEGKLIKYSLPKGGPPAIVDLDGNLDMRIRVKPSRPLVKFTEKAILMLQGDVTAPRIAIQDD